MPEAASHSPDSSAVGRALEQFGIASPAVQAALLAEWGIGSLGTASAMQLIRDFGEAELVDQINDAVALHDQPQATQPHWQEPPLTGGRSSGFASDERHWLHPYFPHDSGSAKRLE